MKKDLISIKRKEEICATLKQMMRRKNIQRITIQELADECGISRYTFYYHFTDVYDCLSWLIHHELQTHVKAIKNCRTWEDAFEKIFYIIQQDHSFLKHLKDSPHPDLLHHLFYQELAPVLRLLLTKKMESMQYVASDAYMNFLVTFYFHALDGMFFVCYQLNHTASIEFLQCCFHTIVNGHLDLILEQAVKKGLCHKTGDSLQMSIGSQSGAWNHLL